MTVNESTSQPAADPRAMAPAYEAADVEARLYKWWEQSGFFQPNRPGARPFTIIMPPPNLTGELHMGHGLTDAVEDALTRWHRMLGDDTLWLPGIDHAAIAVNAIIERELAAEGISRHDIGREAFLERTWEFVYRSRDRIRQQHSRLGASADWSREAFTMDAARERAVRTTFKQLYDDGLIYQAERLINWCIDCGSAISDIEVEYEDEAGGFWYVRYAVADADGNPTGDDIMIATTRPETIPVDTAVAVNPADERLAHLIGQYAIVPVGGRVVPIIGDDAISLETGTGALKVTPGHDQLDFEIGERHGLGVINIMNLDGTLNEAAGPEFAGLERFEARRRVGEYLASTGRLDREEPYTHPVGKCQRSRTVVEPLLSLQWWVDAPTLAGPAIEVVQSGEIRFVPQRFERTYLHWMENIRPWCISRQIWWGHRIPVWYCDDCDHRTVAIEDPDRCAGCGSAAVRQDEDTLDTWFSSGLWPHSTLGWPDETEDLRRFYPTQVMETGYDIIFFWVARMIMLSLYNMQHAAGGSIPFDTVYLHGLVRAPDGQKMSKSRGNVVDPIDSIGQYGTDGLRYALLSGTSPGNDQRITDDRLEAGRNFANKVWNASRFVISMIEDGDDLSPPSAAGAPVEDRWVLSQTERLVADVHGLWERYELAEALRQVRDFFWDEFADWYIEVAKVRVRNGDRSAIGVLAHVLDTSLRLLHPFMPFVTEEIWQRLNTLRPDPAGAPALIVAAYPQPGASPQYADTDAERHFGAAQEIVRAIRNIRAEKRVDASRWVEAYVVPGEAAEAIRALHPALEQLSRARPLHIVDDAAEAPSEAVVTAVLDVGRVVMPMAGLFDIEAERERIQKQIEETVADVERQEAKLANEQFTARAPEAVVQRERERLETAQTRLDGLRASLAELE